MDKTLTLVTGASHGIGLEVARQLAQHGHEVLLTARRLEQANAAVAQLAAPGLVLHARALDVTDPASVAALAGGLTADFGRLDVLINNAGTFADWQEVASTADLEKAHGVLETNLFGAWRVSQALLPLLRRSAHGRLVNVASGAGSHQDPQFGLPTNGGRSASYGISKAAELALTTKLAAELAHTRILVNAVCPGLTATAAGMEAMGARPVADGAASVVWAALLPDDGPRGGFFRDGQPVPW